MSWTAREIKQQPAAWQATQALLIKRSAELKSFLTPLLAQPNLRVILTGAGSSGFIGACLAPELQRVLNRRVEAIPTTDLVATPHLHCQREVPTLLVSFSRSGGSPESLAAVELADREIDRCSQLIITCNPDGTLYQRLHRSHLALLLPDLAYDQGFAMTASFSSMLYATLSLFSGIDAYSGRVDVVGRAAQAVIDLHGARLKTLAEQHFDRVVFLGSGVLTGLAAEAALKLLELTDGAVVATSNSPLGFRHGPKAIVNRHTLVVLFASNDSVARKYDWDLLQELHTDQAAGGLLAISAQPATTLR